VLIGPATRGQGREEEVGEGNRKYAWGMLYRLEEGWTPLHARPKS